METDRPQLPQEIIETILARLKAAGAGAVELANGRSARSADPETTDATAVDPQIVLEPAEGGEPVSVAAPLLERLSRKRQSPEHYHALEELARGGMGSVLKVWDSELRRPIAMKVLIGQNGEASPSVASLARFLEEAQITGQLNHPGIVPVHELGLDSRGRVYFTMRLVRGRNLREIFQLVKTREEGWTTTRALGVLMKVCEAIAYAHSRGVIHRDLKPSNIMVGRYGEVYIMDWGVAKVLGRPDSRDLRLRSAQDAPAPDTAALVQTERTSNEDVDPDAQLVTMDGAVVGTASYMSPEQARGEIERMDQRSDVYSLGAILYQLLTGQVPYVAPDARGVSAHLVWIWVLERPPTPVHELNPAVPAELAAICEKAMARDPRARYADPLEMAADISAYMDGRVVQAHRTGAVVELGKWVTRNKPMALSLAATIGLLLAGLLITAELFRSAEHSARVAEQVAGFLNDDVLGAVAPASEPGRGENLSLGALLDEASKKLAGGRFDSLPEAESPIRLRLGRSYLSLGRYQFAEPHLVRAVELCEQLHGADDARTLEATGALAELRHSQGDFTTAEELYAECLAAWRRIAGRESRAALGALNDLARVHFSLGRLDEAEEQHGDCYETRKRLFGDDDPDTLAAASDLADVYLALGRYEEAEELHSHCLAVRQREPDHPDTLASIASLANVYAFRGRYAAAEAYYSDCLKRRRRVSGEDHPDTLASKSNVAFMHLLRGRYDVAAGIERECLEARRRVLGPNHPDSLASADQLSRIYMYQGLYDSAEELATECLRLRRTALGEEHPHTLVSMETLGAVHWVKGRYDEADRLLSSSLEIRRRLLGKKHPDSLASLDLLASVRDSMGRLEEARELQTDCLRMRSATLGERHPATLGSLSQLGVTLLSLGRLEDAEDLLGLCLKARRDVLGAEHPDTLTSMAELALLRRFQGRFADAEELLDECLETRRLVLGEDHPVLGALDGLAVVYLHQGRLDEAERRASESLVGRRDQLGDRHPSTLRSLSNLAAVNAAQGRLDEAESMLVQCVDTSTHVFEERHPTTLEYTEQLAGVLAQQERFAEAEELQARCVETRRAVHGDEHPRTVTSIIALARIIASRTRFSEAESLLLGCLDFQRRDPARGYPAALDTIDALAQLYADNARFAQALELLEECLSGRTEQLGGQHTKTLDLVFRLGEAYRQVGRFEDAEQLLTASLGALREAPTGDSTGELSLLVSLARLYRQSGRYELAASAGVRALELAQVAFGPQHAVTTARLDELALTYEQAARDTARVRDAAERALHFERLADVDLRRERPGEALAALEQSLESTRAALGAEHEDFFRRLRKLAGALAAQGVDADAEPLWIESLAGLRRVAGEGAGETLLVLEDLATFYVDRGRAAEAAPLVEELLAATEVGDPAEARRRALEASVRAALER